WAEERRQGTMELLLTLPVTTAEAVIGKFLAGWALLGLALLLTIPLWAAIACLGAPDHGVVVASYAGAWLLAGAMLAVSGALSACTRSQVVAFVLAVVVCFLVMLAGYPLVQEALRGWVPSVVLDAIAQLSFLTRFQGITRGVLALGDLVFFLATIGAWLWATVVVVDAKKAG
ncbi:MAG: ABC transporter permease subunit, partial [Xanthomonadaceae bacterium]|nr:ABC transporter permease subunit [Xanthomonadaceae bacterium]